MQGRFISRRLMRAKCCRKLFLLCALVVVVAVGRGEAQGAAPWCVIVHGNLVQNNIVLADLFENQKLMLSIAELISIGDRDLRDRPYVDMSYFWGPEWMHYPNDERSLDKLEPKTGNQHGRFYPAYASREAVVTFDEASGPLRRKITKDGLEILAKYGIPIRVAQAFGPMPLRIGLPRALTDQDIASVGQALESEGRPWLLDGGPAQFGTAQFIYAFLPATFSTPTLRRGTVIFLERRNSRTIFQRPTLADPWDVQRTESYAQVAIPGRNFDDIQGDEDVNRPFRIPGKFEDAEIVSLVNFIRSDPPARGSTIQHWPILSITRKADDSFEVLLRGGINYGQFVGLRKTSESWVIVDGGAWGA